MSRPRRLGAVGLGIVVVAVTAGCSIEETLPPPTCGGDGGSVLIAAQSVPTGSLLPCLEPLPTGWEVDTVSVTEAGTVVSLDSDRAGIGAARVRYVATCDTAGAVSTASDQSAAERYERIHQITPRFVADRFYVFPGGCVWWEFDFDAEAPSALSVELGSRLVLVDREEVNDDLRANFLDEDL